MKKDWNDLQQLQQIFQVQQSLRILTADKNKGKEPELMWVDIFYEDFIAPLVLK